MKVLPVLVILIAKLVLAHKRTHLGLVEGHELLERLSQSLCLDRFGLDVVVE